MENSFKISLSLDEKQNESWCSNKQRRLVKKMVDKISEVLEITGKMRRWDPKTHWESEGSLPKAKQIIKEQNNFVRIKEKSTEKLRNISPPIVIYLRKAIVTDQAKQAC